MCAEKQLTQVNEWLDDKAPRIIRESPTNGAMKLEHSDLQKDLSADSNERYTAHKILLTRIKSNPGNTMLLRINPLNHV
jgi:hypothetical protein